MIWGVLRGCYLSHSPHVVVLVVVVVFVVVVVLLHCG